MKDNREEVWIRAWIKTINSAPSMTPTKASDYADMCLEDFDTRFSKDTKCKYHTNVACIKECGCPSCQRQMYAAGFGLTSEMSVVCRCRVCEASRHLL